MSSPDVKVDWTIPVWGIVGLVIQALVAAMWIGAVEARVKALESRQIVIDGMPERVARIEERTVLILDRLQVHAEAKQ